MRCWFGVVELIAVLSVGSVAQAQVVAAVGTEFQVNTYTTSNQDSPAICGTADGRFVVVWGGGEQVRTEIFAQLYSSAGTPVGTEFQVNTYTSEEQERPSVCCDGSGNFVVVWRQETGQDGDDNGVFGQRFASDGSFVGSEFQVNTYTTGDQGYPAVCCSADGDFVVSWESYEQDGARGGIFGQRFASSGSFSGTEFRINTYTQENQTQPTLCCSAAGDFVVAWNSDTQDGEAQGIFGQRFSADGALQGTEFQVNTYTTESQRLPAICCSAEGGFVVAWEDDSQHDGDSSGIFGQRFASDGSPRGSEFRATVSTQGNQLDPTICCGAAGDFVVSWENVSGGGYAILARRFTDSGVPLSGDVRASEFTTETYQTNPAVACREDGGFVVVWQKFPDDGDDFGVFGRRFALLAVAPTPVLSWIGLVAVVSAFLAIGVKSLLRRS